MTDMTPEDYECDDDIPVTCPTCGATVPLLQTDGEKCWDCLPFADDAKTYPRRGSAPMSPFSRSPAIFNQEDV